MIKESMSELHSAFAEWRLSKKHKKERIPVELLARARRLVEEHGASHVGYRLGIAPARLAAVETQLKAVEKSVSPLPNFTRMEITPPRTSLIPLAEAETPMGIKLRVFAMTSETINLLSSFCRASRGDL